VLTATRRSYMGKARFRPPTKSKPLNGLEYNLAQLIMSRKSAPKPNFVAIGSAGILRKYVKYTIICYFIFPNRPRGHNPNHFFYKKNGLNDVDSHTYVPFAVKVETFSNPRPLYPRTAKIWPFSGLRKFSLDFTFNIK